MLAVGIDAPAERIAVIRGVLPTGRDPGRKAAVRAERDHLGPALAGDLGRAIGRAVVDDEHVGLRKLLPKLVEHSREVLLLVPGRHEHERVALGGHEASSSRASTVAQLRDVAVTPRPLPASFVHSFERAIVFGCQP